jgi:hypothetical protein
MGESHFPKPASGISDTVHLTAYTDPHSKLVKRHTSCSKIQCASSSSARPHSISQLLLLGFDSSLDLLLLILLL